MMDTVLNLGLNDDDGRGAVAKRAGDARFAYDSYRRFITDVFRTSCSASSTTISRRSSTSFKDRKGYTLDTDLTADDWTELDRALQGASSRSELGKPFPQDPHEQLWGAIGAVFGSWMNAARHHLPRAARHPGELGHGRQRAGDGVRQHGRDLGHRRRLHPQSLDRRERALRRVPHQRPGRGRRRRHPHAAGHHRAGAHRGRLRQALDGSGDAGGLSPSSCASTACSRSTTATCRTSSSPSSAASSGCCRRAPASAPRKAALRIAVDMAERGPDHAGGGGRRVEPGGARPAAAPDDRSRRPSARSSRRGLPASPGRRVGRDRVQLRRGRGGQEGRAARSSWCASRPAPRTSTACTPPRAS